MRKHSVRKWIHAICDLLPLLVIPIFAISVRSDNNFEPIELTIQEITPRIEYTYKYQTNDLNSLNDFVLNNVYHCDYLLLENGYGYTFELAVYNIEGFFSGYCYNSPSYSSPYENYITNEGYYELDFGTYNALNGSCIYIRYLDDDVEINFTNQNKYYTCFIDGSDGFGFELEDFDFSIISGLDSFKNFIFDFDLFEDDAFSSSTFNIITSASLAYDSTTSVTYNDTDVGSQMVYTLYNTCDKYFNFNNVGVFQDLYDWFGTNLFNGSTPPMSFFIVWNVILYEFIMDLIFLTYMVFMFVIDFTECMIDRFFEKSYRGGR